MSITYKTPYDTRVVEYHLRKGTVTHADYAKHMNDLPDEVDEWDETDTHFVAAYENRNYGTGEQEAESSEAV